ncbi:sulfatase family protein [Wenxinia saemankumensis]|uniref:Arylsulfatase A n=1 Tax=Wenxinia saemankumensis TaxID=1447782 RepID=A0A1M6AF54_9RHOB|nr:sulfatase-like hydrolase/transferase [Wenxinia saemankumensis]SHI35042.1 Arylsulfatase A [Wenxinia saemankumensis]
MSQTTRTPPGPAGEPPHIILIMTDQQRFDTIRATGADWMHTPNLDRLATEGVVFDRCFVNAPSCVPSRAALFSGVEPHVSGVLRNGQAWQETWVGNLAAAGYHCVSVGKMHTIPYDAPAGFHERFVVENKDRFYEGRWFADELDKAIAAHGLTKPSRAGYRALPDYRDRLGAVDWTLPEHLHPDSFVAGTARWWLETRPKPERLFLQIGLPGPHPPYDPPPADTARYAGSDLPLPEVTEEELAALPAYLQEKRRHDVEVDHDAVAWKAAPTRAELQRLRAHYAANVTLIDREIGRLMEVLEAQGYLENAVVVFCSDHGDALGDHGLSQKWSMYEPVTRVPLIVWSPGRFAPRRDDRLCQLFDIGPTILDLAGAARPDPCHARTLLPALEGDDGGGRDIVVCEQAGDVSMTGARLVTMIRDRRWKAVFIHGASDGQLFDLETDPDERTNLWADESAQDQKRRLSDALAEWRTETMLQGMDRFARAR